MTNQPAHPNNLDLINQVTSFYKQYLDCSPEQLDLLALWTMHTHIIPGAPFSPALNICSRQKHSGKTLCLQLLSLLCDTPSMHTAAAPSLLLHQVTDDYEHFSGTLLLDDCDATFGKTRMNIKLQGLFTARFQQDARFTIRVKDAGEYVFDERFVFFPTAFAGNGHLHPSLAERSIQIALEPKKTGSACQPFRFYAARDSAKSLSQSLSDWGSANHEHFEKVTPYKDSQFPPELSWRNRDCAEPLLHIADFIGGEWPQRARQSLVNAFALAAFEDFYNSKLILSDIRDAFSEKGNPEWISSADLLQFLHTLDNRTWDDWTKGKPMHPKALAHLLAPFGIHPRNHRTGTQTVPKGYYLQDLEPAWQHHLPPAGVAANLQNSSRRDPKLEASSQKLGADLPVAANLQNSVVALHPDSIPRDQVKETNSPKVVDTPAYVAANPQNLLPNNSKPKPAASSQKLAAPNARRDPLRGVDWRAAATNTPAPTHFVDPKKKEGIGQKIMRSVFHDNHANIE